MFAKFLRLKQCKDPASTVAQDQAYVNGPTTSAGEKRHERPVLIAGFDRETMGALGRIASLDTKRPATVGSINFGEHVNDKIRTEIALDFVDFVFAGIDAHQRGFSLVGHTKVLKGTNQLSTDIHFAILRMLLQSGRIFTPYFARVDGYSFNIWAERLNYRHGFSSPFDPQNRRVFSPRSYGSDSHESAVWKKSVGALVEIEWVAGRLKNSTDVSDLIKSLPNVKDVKQTEKGVEVLSDRFARPVRLNALIFEPSYDFDRLRRKLEDRRRMTQEEVEREYQRILQLRIERHWARYGKPILFNTRKKYITRQELAYEPITYQSTPGKIWGPAIEFDRIFGATLDHVGGTCLRLGQRLGEIGGVLGDCLQEEEPIGGGRSGDQNALADFIGAFDRFGSGCGRLHNSVLGTLQALGGSDGVSGKVGVEDELAGLVAEATTTVRLQIVEWPRSCEEVIRAATQRCQGRRLGDRQLAWFVSDSTAIKPEVHDWLRRIDPDGADEMDQTLAMIASLAERGIAHKELTRE